MSKKPAFAGFFVVRIKMTNRIEIYAEFDFKGKSFHPVADIDLDSAMEKHGEIPPLTQILARESGIGLYSYELEVLETVPVMVGRAEGLAKRFVLQDGRFDGEGFEAEWQNEAVRRKMDVIAQQYPSIEEAMFAAYKLGREDGRQERARDADGFGI